MKRLFTLFILGMITIGYAQETVFISEVADPGDHYDGRFIELYNSGTSTVDLGAESWYLARQSNGGSSYTNIELIGTIGPGETFVIAYDSTLFESYYGFLPNMDSGNINGNGDDAYFLFKGGNASSGTKVDIYGQEETDGTGTDWEYKDAHAVRNSNVLSPNTTWTVSEWTITSADVADMTPGQHTVDDGTVNPEPTNHVTDFAAGNATAYSIDLTWTGSTGTQLPDKYLILGKTDAGAYPAVADGAPVDDDSDWSDGAFAVNVSHADGANTYTVSGLDVNTHYSFTIYPYTNSGSDIDYKTDGTVPTADATTLDMALTTIVQIMDTTGMDTDTSSYYEQTVRVRGLVYAVRSSSFWIMDGTGAYTGIYVYDGSQPAVGDSVEIVGEVTMYYGLVEIANLSKMVILNSGNGLPEAIALATGDINTGGKKARMYQSVFVKVTGKVDNLPDQYKEWSLNDGSGSINVDDLFYEFTPNLGQNYTVQGPLYYSYSNYKIEPREAGDITTDILSTPAEHVTSFAVSSVSDKSVTLSWTDAAGDPAPQKYLVLGRTDAGAFATVKDSIPVDDDEDWSDGNAALNVAYGEETVTFSGLTAETKYYFVIYPYNNDGDNIKYKTDGTVPAVDTTTSEALTTIYWEDFESSNYKATTVNVSGSKEWYRTDHSGNYYMKMSGYKDGANEDWLITFGYNFDRSSNEFISFKSSRKYGDAGNNGTMTFLYSTDYDGVGNPNDFTWTDLTSQVTLSEDNYEWVESGDVDISAISGTAYFAWKYVSTDSNTPTWQIDDILITGIISDKEPEINTDAITLDPMLPSGDDDAVFTVEVVDDDQSGLAVSLVYTVNGGSENTVAMTLKGGITYEGAIPASAYNDGDVVRFQFRATDAVGTVSMNDWFGFLVGTEDIETLRSVDRDGVAVYGGIAVHLSGILSAPVQHYGTLATHTSLQVSSDQGVVVINYDSTMTANDGDSVDVIGVIGQYNGLLQMEWLEYKVLKENAGTPAPTEMKLSDFVGDFDACEYYEGGLVMIKNLKVIEHIEDWGSGNHNFTVTDDDSVTQITMRIVENMGIWEDMPQAPANPIDVLCIIGQYDYSSPYTDGYQLLPIDIVETTAIDGEEGTLPGKFTVSQNYPNPFNPTTTVDFYLSNAEKVTFSVYTVTGRKVHEESARYNSGKNTIRFDASKLASGVYFYKVKAGSNVAVKKMVLMK